MTVNAVALTDTLALHPESINLYWLTAQTTCTDPELSILNATEAKQAAQYRVSWKQQQYRRAKACQRIVLGAYLKQAPPTLTFQQNQYGKPYLAPQASLSMHFNLSHSKHQSLLGVCEQTIGVDIESTRHNLDIESFAAHHFHPQEIKYIAHASRSQAAFYEIFTRKEAVLKAIGIGLIDNLNSFNCASSIVRLPAELNSPCDWHVQTHHLADDVVFSVASKLPLKTLHFYQLVSLQRCLPKQL
jgi:4'-phosphopantetheinyl transferase